MAIGERAVGIAPGVAALRALTDETGERFLEAEIDYRRWISRRRLWEGYRVWGGRTGKLDVILGTYQTLGARHAAEAYLT